jgi:hypothetical protein
MSQVVYTLRLGVISILLLFAVSVGTAIGADSEYLFGRRVGDRVVYPAQGVQVMMEALDPTLMRWYLPQELYLENGRRQWSYSNYADKHYRRYLDSNLEGDYFYDSYGNMVTRGWRIYDWRQTQPSSFETSSLTKFGRYVSWFDRVVVSSDVFGDYSYSITIGDELNTTLTPMTFRKAGYNGVVASFASGRSRFTGIFGRLTAPIIDSQSTIFVESFTNLTGGRLITDVRDNVTLGVTFVSTHNGNGTRKAFGSNPLKGRLTAGQLSQRMDFVALRLTDDSPEDGEGGVVLISSDVEITTSLMRPVLVDGSVQLVARDTVILGSSIGFTGARVGGQLQNGFLTADGPESITISYSLAPENDSDDLGSFRLRLQQALNLSLSDAEDAITNIVNVRFRLVLANDYRIEVASNRQANLAGQPQFLPVTRAPGNIKNGLNQRLVVFDYGLPTANQILGFTIQTRDFLGFDAYAEVNINNQYRQYPNTEIKKHRSFSGIFGDEQSLAFMVDVRRRLGRLDLTGEAFGMDHDYSTSLIPVDGRGFADYSPDSTHRHYDLVDDNDDNDRHPDQLRIFQGSLIPPRTTTSGNFQIEPDGQADPAVFPGYDENNDGLSDFNQNSSGDQENFFPDYEEPFLRHNTDRPEFLFGMDMNNNGWVDRFENDNEPDYPYKKDHWGYNVHGRVDLIPGVLFTVGRLAQERRQTDHRSRINYAIAAYDRDDPTWGRLRIFDMAKSAKDNIRDDLVQWLMPEPEFGDPGQSSGSNQNVADLLGAQDTWINTFYADWQYQSPSLWRMTHKVKWETWRQRDTDMVFEIDAAGELLRGENGEPLVAFDPLRSDTRNGRKESGFFGVINKADYQFDWGRLTLTPRIKSEIIRLVPFERQASRRRTWDLIPSLLVRMPLMTQSAIELGWEQRLFYELRHDEEKLAAGSRTGDFDGLVLSAQLVNSRAYLGYEVTTLLGVRLDRRRLEVIDRNSEKLTSGLAFLTVFASIR